MSKPLKKTRVLNLSGGEQTTIFYYYEKVQKICTHCQSLTHANPRFPFLSMQQGDLYQNPNTASASQVSHQVLSESNPLFGVLRESQVGINPISGRPRIDPEVLQKMRNYLTASNNEDRAVREQRVISSFKEAEKNPFTQKSILQLTTPPIFTTDLNKGKGIAFDFDTNPSSFKSLSLLINNVPSLWQERFQLVTLW